MSNYQIKKNAITKKFLVLGGRGFIGSHLVEALLREGFCVRCFDRPNVNKLMEVYSNNPNFEMFEGDFTAGSDVVEALDGCDVCYHLISTTKPQSSNEDQIFDVQSNLLATIQFLSHAIKAGVSKVIFISSGGTVYGNYAKTSILETDPTEPISSYGVVKLAIEKYLAIYNLMYGLDYAILRISNCYGEGQELHSGQGAVPVFLDKALKGNNIEIWGDGTVVRDYVYIDDVIKALLLVVDCNSNERIFNIGSGVGYSINQILDAIEDVVGKKVLRVYKQSRSCDVPVNVLNVDRAKLVLRWTPQTNLKDGIKRLIGSALGDEDSV
jgi:UDP-glucose 4-epimerase